jgi:uncharacterized membrane protein
MAFYLAIAAGATLIYFTHHISWLIEAPSVIAEVGEEIDATIDRERARDRRALPLTRAREREAAREMPAEEGAQLPAPTSGYIQTLDADGLVVLARDAEVVIEMLAKPGDYVFAGGAIAQVWPGPEGGARAELARKLRENMVVGKRRTPVQDLSFAFNQVAEIAVRAMSPALNDPFTALDCVNRIGAGFARLAKHAEPSPYLRDGSGRLRVVIQPVRFDELVAGTLAPVRNYARASVIVTLQMLRVLENLAPLLRTEAQRRVVAREATLIRRGADASDGLAAAEDRHTTQLRYEAVLRALGLTPGEAAATLETDV